MFYTNLTRTSCANMKEKFIINSSRYCRLLNNFPAVLQVNCPLILTPSDTYIGWDNDNTDDNNSIEAAGVVGGAVVTADQLFCFPATTSRGYYLVPQIDGKREHAKGFAIRCYMLHRLTREKFYQDNK